MRKPSAVPAMAVTLAGAESDFASSNSDARFLYQGLARRLGEPVDHLGLDRVVLGGASFGAGVTALRGLGYLMLAALAFAGRPESLGSADQQEVAKAAIGDEGGERALALDHLVGGTAHLLRQGGLKGRIPLRQRTQRPPAQACA